MAVDGYSVQLICSFLDGSSVYLPTQGEAVTGDLVEGHSGLPMRIPGGGDIVNIKLSSITDPAWVAVWGDEDVQVRIVEDGTWLGTNPFAFVGAMVGGLGISEVWIRNNDNEEHAVTIYAAES